MLKNTGSSVWRGQKALRFATQEELREAFLWEEDRKVDRAGCIKFGGVLYDAGPQLAGRKVEIRFDTFDERDLPVGKLFLPLVLKNYWPA